jgi:hypothetical protein
MVRVIFALFLTVFVSVNCFGDPPKTDNTADTSNQPLSELAKIKAEYKAQEIARVKREIETDKEWLRTHYSSLQAKDDEREAIRKRLAKNKEWLRGVESGKTSVEIPSILGKFPLQVGTYGSLDVVNVFQKINDKEAICRVYTAEVSGAVLSGNRYLVPTYKTVEHLILFKGFDCSKVVNGAGLGINAVVKVSGTYTYQTANGTNTIFVLERVSDKAEATKTENKPEK